MPIPGPKTKMTLCRRTQVPDLTGGYEITWIPFTTLTGMLSTKSGKETFLNDKKTVEVTHKFFCFYTDEPHEYDKLMVGDTEYEILFVGNPGNRGTNTEIMLRKLI